MFSFNLQSRYYRRSILTLCGTDSGYTGNQIYSVINANLNLFEDERNIRNGFISILVLVCS